MKHSSQSYTDLDVAEYVIGLTAPDDAHAIQDWLAKDDAAAACALKWEAYLLGIADAVPREAPTADLYARIQASLGFTAEADAATIVHEGRQVRAERPRDASARRRPGRLRRGRVAAAAAVLAAVILSGVLGVALLRPAEPQATEQSVQLTPVNPALPAPTGSGATGHRG